MRASIKALASIYRIIVFLLLSLVSVYFYLNADFSTKKKPVSGINTLAISPIVPDLSMLKERPVEPTIKSVEIKRDQTFTELMQEQGFDQATIEQVYASSKDVYNLAQIHVGKTLLLTTTPENEFSRLSYVIDPLKTLVINKSDGQITVEMREHPIESRVGELGGLIQDSLYSTMNRLGEQDELVIRFADIFEWDVDFFRDLQEGDSFRIIFEKRFVEGKPFGYGNILAAELMNKGKIYSAIGYKNGDSWEFFSPDGKAMRKAFLASPLKFSRISAGFTNRRYHPILHRYRPHYGIDYVAPIGTPVRSIGNGRVTLAGWAGGAGRCIKIQHTKEIATVYGHLSRFAPGIKAGASVSQGQVIGYVGSTGMSTGPHLDFRYIKNGRYVNFLSIKSPQAAPLSHQEVEKFRQATREITERLANVELIEPAPLLAHSSPSSFQLSEELR